MITSQLQDENKLLKRSVDILSVICVVFFILVPWMQFIDLLQAGSHILYESPQKNVPLLILFTMDFLLFMCGLYWLFYRYEKRISRRLPVFIYCRLHEVLILLLLVTPHLLISME